MKVYLSFVNKLNKLLEVLVVIMLVLLTAIVIAQIVTREMHISVSWLEEGARYTMIYVCFLGAALCTRRGTLVKIDILNEMLPKGAMKYINVLTSIISLVFLAFALYSCMQFLPVGMQRVASSMTKIKMVWFYLAMPVGMEAMVLNIIANLFEGIQGGNKE